MRTARNVVVTGLAIVLSALPALAGQAPSPPGQAQQQQQPPPPPQPPPQPPPPRPEATYRETVVVSASKTEQQLVDAPATMSVIGERALSVSPSSNYADLLRSVPGVNITQISARDVNITSRSATGSLATQQLTVVDGRSLYQDFFGFTMWDFLPANLDEIKQIEAIRGPASAVWGANALTGVVNVITKSPREMAGSSVTFGVGGFGREVDDDNESAGSLFYVRGTHAEAVNDRWAYKVSAGVNSSDAFARPTGLIPGGTTPYPDYMNTGTTQPKVDVRVDYDFPDGQRSLQFSGGVAGTDGVMHTGIGPFDIDRGTVMGYWKANFNRGAFHAQAFMNVLDGQATNLVSVGPDGVPIPLDFSTKTFDVELGDTRLVRSKHVLTYGGNLRLNRFDLTIAPGENSRTEGGAYLQDEYLLNDTIRLVAGARVDKFSSIDNPVFSPRLAAVYKLRTNQSVRVSYNRAFRAPSMVNNNLDITLATPLPLGLFHPAYGSATYLLPTFATGNPELTEEHIDAFEIAFTGIVADRASVSAALYYNTFTDEIFFTQTSEWGAVPPPPGFPDIPGVPGSAALVWGGAYLTGIRFPQSFTYLNLGEVTTKGIELGIDGSITPEFSAFANYSFQAKPVPGFEGLTDEEAEGEINLPAQHLLNVGVSYVGPSLFGSFAISHSTDAFWQDVLDARFHGFTEAYTLANLTVGKAFQNGRYTGSVKITNLFNQDVQQHVFGDVMKRAIVGEFKVKVK
jgi:iron complex outermembrane receptor protein